MVNIAFQIGLMLASFFLLLFGGAGRLDLPFFWAYFLTIVLVVLIGPLVVDRDLLQERLKPAPGGIDRHLRSIGAPLFALHLLIAGLDVGRFRWSGEVPFRFQLVCMIVFVLAFFGSFWAISVNRFFSPVVRIQDERGHHVVTTGPYRFIRHPGYSAAMIWGLCSGVALGSPWSIIPLVPLLVLLLRRTIIEDRFLHDHLPGYRDYAQRVRHRLIPGLW